MSISLKKIQNYIWSAHTWRESTNLIESDLQLVDVLYKTLDAIKPCGDDNRHELWIYAPDAHEKKHWFSLLTVEYKEYRTVCVGGAVVIRIEPRDSSRNCGFPFEMTDLLEWLIDSAKNCVQMLKDGNYNDFIEKNLPFDYRMGTIPRKKFYELYPEEISENPIKLTDEETAEFIRFAESGNFDEYGTLQSDFVFPSMTANKYFKICACGYRANKISFDYYRTEKLDLDSMNPFDLYNRFADNRDGGLHVFPSELRDSEQEFLDWYNAKDDKKWERRCDDSHSWEVIEGSSRTNMHLFLDGKENGWTLSLRGNITYCAEELVHFYLGLAKNGIFPELGNAKKLLAKVKCEDKLGIISKEEEPISYSYGGFPDSDVVNFINMPKRKKKTFIKAASWYDLKKVELK